MARPKLDFCTRFRKLGSNPEDWDHKKGLLNGEIHLKVSKRFFSGQKKISCLKMIFGPSWSFLDMKFFLARKKRFDTFRWISPYSMIFLWSQSSGFASSIRNLVRNWYFTQTDPLRLAALQKNGKNQKTPIPATFSCFEGFKPSKQLQTSFWPSLTAFRSQNFCLRKFSQFSLSLLKMEKFSKMAIWGPNLG